MVDKEERKYEAGGAPPIWSEWAPFAEAAKRAPLTPGVYQLQCVDRKSPEEIVYVGMAGERSGKGIRGRLYIYFSGKGAVSGFGEAALDRALRDPTFIEQQLTQLRAGQEMRAKEWARAAIDRMNCEIRWAECASGADAAELEKKCLRELPHEFLWNRRKGSPAPTVLSGPC